MTKNHQNMSVIPECKVRPRFYPTVYRFFMDATAWEYYDYYLLLLLLYLLLLFLSLLFSSSLLLLLLLLLVVVVVVLIIHILLGPRRLVLHRASACHATRYILSLIKFRNILYFSFAVPVIHKT